MKTLPAPNILGETEVGRMDATFRMLLFSASEEAFVEQETKHKRARDRKK
jgi:hypothetical protein